MNTSRENAVFGLALLHKLKRGRIAAAPDVWPNEPDLAPDLLKRCLVATQHVAGYSVQGRLNGALRIYPERHEFPHWRIEGADAGSRKTLNALGFQVSRG